MEHNLAEIVEDGEKRTEAVTMHLTQKERRRSLLWHKALREHGRQLG